MNELAKNHEFLCGSFIPFLYIIEGCYTSEQVLDFTRTAVIGSKTHPDNRKGFDAISHTHFWHTAAPVKSKNPKKKLVASTNYNMPTLD